MNYGVNGDYKKGLVEAPRIVPTYHNNKPKQYCIFGGIAEINAISKSQNDGESDSFHVIIHLVPLASAGDRWISENDHPAWSGGVQWQLLSQILFTKIN